MSIQFNDLETNRFGIRCARVIEVDASLSEIDQAARDQKIRFLSIRVPTEKITRVQELESNGFRLMDTLVYYECALDAESVRLAEQPDFMLRDVEPDDIPEISAIARSAFAGYFGHYHADPRLDGKAADSVYIDWAEVSAARSSEDCPVLVVQHDSGLGGFLAFRRNSPVEFEIVLNAVHPASEGQGFYTALVVKALVIAHARQASRMIVSTQINNYRVQRVWARLGFAHFQSFYTLHKWYDDEGSK